MKPYGNLKSKNLALMLFLTRVFVYLGGIAFFLGVASFVVAAFADYGAFAATFGVTLFTFALSILIASSLLAALVAFEDNYRRRTEHLISKNET